MKILIEPKGDGFNVTFNNWGIGVQFETYEGAILVVNTILHEQKRSEQQGIVTIDYSKCLDR